MSFFSRAADWLDSDEYIVDVWSFRARERLAVHEARTRADLDSSIVRASEQECAARNGRCRAKVALVIRAKGKVA